MMNRKLKQLLIAAACLLSVGVLHARSVPEPESGSALYIVLLDQAPLAEWYSRGGDGPASSLQGSDAGKRAKAPVRGKLDVATAESRDYLRRLDENFEQFQAEAGKQLGRDLKPVHQYRNALNGFAASMTAEEARRVAAMPGVKLVRRDEIQKLETDAGPAWIGAAEIWNGTTGLPEARGEGVIVGVIDSGINWKHDSFQDPGEGGGAGHDHTNPLGMQLGLCSQPEVLCNDKLIGVYEFVTDIEDTDVVEEGNNGYDNDGHGSHVASTAVGNTSEVSFTFGLTTLSGVAPNANLVSYRVCYIGDPDDPDDDGCSTAAIADAIDQAIDDGVDVINYSIGSSAFSPWVEGTTTRAFLNVVAAGIFVATSAGNSGPEASTIGAPANAPWISAVGNATHNRLFGTIVRSFTGGDTPVPPPLTGASWLGNSGIRKIVHAKDYGYPLCGAVTETTGSVACSNTSSASNPWPPGTFDGEIVVCDRGTYGRIEKGLNVELAGAGGYILANTEEWGKSITADNHCLPASHLTAEDGDKLRTWLDSGTGHQGQITGSSRRTSSGSADLVASSSSRGPALSPVQDVLKPNVIAPGTSILGAFAEDGDDESPYVLLGGTSMASPHVAGAAALLLSVNPDWTPSVLSSAIETTATMELATDSDGTIATPFEAGSGRPRLGEAAHVGLYLEETAAGFEAANPGLGGEPGELNLPGMAESECRDRCSFTRTVTSLTSTKTWSAAASGFPEGVVVIITPDEFSLANGASQQLDIEIDLSAAGQVGNWVYGKVMLSASGEPDQALTTAVYATGGDLPDEWTISATTDAGDKAFFLSSLTALRDATFTSGGLTREQSYTEALPEDPTDDDPFDSPTGTFTILQEVPEGSLWLHTETLASTALDLDLFVGIDSNHDGKPEEDEQICSSTTPQDLELCDIYNPTPGTYWIVVQNWHESNNSPDDATLVWAVVGDSGELGLAASAQGITATDETFPVRVSWNNVDAVPGETLLGAVGIGTDRDHPNNVGIIPVRFTRTSIKAPETLALMDGRTQRLALRATGTHDRIFIDVPAGADSLTVTASGADEAQNNALSIALKRVDFDVAFDDAPLVAAAPDGPPIDSATGANGVGPEVTVSGAQLVAGRWYVVLSNSGANPASVAVQADTAFSGGPGPIHAGLWEPASRPGISHGLDYALGDSRAMIWYTYDEQGMPTWYLAAGPNPTGDIWTADVQRFTNDGAQQQEAVVGQLSMTTLAEVDLVFSWQLFGRSGSDRMKPLAAPNACPEIDGSKKSYTGLWFRGLDGLGGASVLVLPTAQAQIHYLYDAVGAPRWLIAANDGNQSATDREITMLQFKGFCPTCVGSVSSAEAGLLTRDFTSESTGSWNLNYMLLDPLVGDVNRTENTIKITSPLVCN